MAFYRKKELQELIPWNDKFPTHSVNISAADKANGSPKDGDMIAFNPEDSGDMWLVPEKLFIDNYVVVADVSGHLTRTR